MKKRFIYLLVFTVVIITIVVFAVHDSAKSNFKQAISVKDADTTIDVVAKRVEERIIECRGEKKNAVVIQKTYYSTEDIIDISKVLYNECRGLSSKTEQACVVWTILNRVDEFGEDIGTIVREDNQYAFSEDTPIDNELYKLAEDVLIRWNREKNGENNVGRVLPSNYLHFTGYNGHNHFRSAFAEPYTIWNYSLSSPYES